MLLHAKKTSFPVNILQTAILVFFHVCEISAFGACSRHIYGSPQESSCEAALIAMPRDAVAQYFVEQQLRRKPGMNWLAFADPRLPGQRQKIVEVPKWWSRSSCNIALVSFNHGNDGVGESLSQWSNIFGIGIQLLMECLVKDHAGGSAVITGNGARPVLSLFVWEDGAWFDDIFNDYWGTDSPSAIDPLNPLKLLINSNSTGDMNQTLSMISQNISIS